MRHLQSEGIFIDFQQDLCAVSALQLNLGDRMKQTRGLTEGKQIAIFWCTIFTSMEGLLPESMKDEA